MSAATAGLEMDVALQQQAGNLDTITPAGGLVLVKDSAGGGEGQVLGGITASVNGTPAPKMKAQHNKPKDGAESGENGHLEDLTSEGSSDAVHLEATSVAVAAKPEGEVAVVVDEVVADVPATGVDSMTGGPLSNEEFGSTTSSSETDSETDEELDNIKTEIEKRLPPSISDIALADRVQVRHVHLLYNPMSGNRRGEKVMRRAKRKLEERGLLVTATRLERKGHAEQLCETMDFTGIDVVCAVGGDGTFHECVNGMMKRLHPNFVNEYRGGLKNRRGSLSEMSDLIRSKGEEGSGGNGSSSESEYRAYKRSEELKQRKKTEKRERKLKEKEEKAKGKEKEREERETEKMNKKKEKMMRKEGIGSLAIGSKASRVRIHVEEVFLSDDDEDNKKRKAIASRLAEKGAQSETMAPVALDPEAERAMKRRWTLPGRMRRKPLKEGDAARDAEEEAAGEPEEWERQKQRDEDEAEADRGYESEGEKKKKKVDKSKKTGTKSDDEGQITRSGQNRINRRLPSLPGSKRYRKKRNAHKAQESEDKDAKEPKEQKDPAKHGAKSTRRFKKKQSHSHRTRPNKLLQEALDTSARSASFEGASASPSLMTESSPSFSVTTSSWPSSPNLSGSVTPPRSPPSESSLFSSDTLSPVPSDGKEAPARRKRSVDSSTDDLLGPRTGTRSPRVPPLALIAAGTGNSFMHEIGCAKMKQAVDHICRGVHYPLDICRLYFGDDSTCYSFNSIHWGLASKVNVTAEKLRWMGNAIRYTTAVFVQMMKGKTTLAKISLVDENDNVIEYDESFCLAIANNIITASKGMKMAPTAKIDDGLIDLLLITTSSSIELMHIFKKVYDGTHVDLPYVRYIKVKKFSITPYKIRGKENKEYQTEDDIEEIEELLDVDGELKGCTPFTCEVLPRALRFIL